MLSFLLATAAVVPLWTLPVDSNCRVWPSPKGDRVLVACTSERGMQLAIRQSDGRTVDVERLDREIAQNGVATGPAAWSPTGEEVAIEIGLDEEPAILLIDASQEPSAIFVDRELAAANVSGADPQWDTTGKWLIFRTSGTGDWNNEGIYVRESKSGTTRRLVNVVPRSITVAGDTLFVTRSQPGSTKSELMTFSLTKLLKQDVSVDTEMSARKRQGKD